MNIYVKINLIDNFKNFGFLCNSHSLTRRVAGHDNDVQIVAICIIHRCDCNIHITQTNTTKCDAEYHVKHFC